MTVQGVGGDRLSLDDIERCFQGHVPAVLATASADGVPNITYLSRVLRVDAGRVALSNQFLSKSARNLAENPTASLLLIDGDNQDEYRLTVVYERTERRGQVFEQMRADVDAIAAMTGMQDVFRLQAADIYRVEDITVLRRHEGPDASRSLPEGPRAVPDVGSLSDLCLRLSRCGDLDTLVRVAVDGLAGLLGHEHSLLLLLDEEGTRLFTIASRGYDQEGVGAEVPMGEGLIGMAAAQGRPIKVGNLRQMTKYGESVRRAFEESGGIGPGHEIPMPGLARADSRLAVPAMALGQVVGVVVVESDRAAEYGDEDVAALQVVASLLASAVESIRAEERAAPVRAVVAPGPRPEPPAEAARTHVRFFPVDGSTFLDGDYLIKGVAGRILWSLLRQHTEEGRVDFTNREVRLDPSLDLPDFRDNFESRLILLKRRLDERAAAIRIEKTGRGRFRLDVAAPLHLESRGDPD